MRFKAIIWDIKSLASIFSALKVSSKTCILVLTKEKCRAMVSLQSNNNGGGNNIPTGTDAAAAGGGANNAHNSMIWSHFNATDVFTQEKFVVDAKDDDKVYMQILDLDKFAFALKQCDKNRDITMQYNKNKFEMNLLDRIKKDDTTDNLQTRTAIHLRGMAVDAADLDNNDDGTIDSDLRMREEAPHQHHKKILEQIENNKEAHEFVFSRSPMIRLKQNMVTGEQALVINQNGVLNAAAVSISNKHNNNPNSSFFGIMNKNNTMNNTTTNNDGDSSNSATQQQQQQQQQARADLIHSTDDLYQDMVYSIPVRIMSATEFENEIQPLPKSPVRFKIQNFNLLALSALTDRFRACRVSQVRINLEAHMFKQESRPPRALVEAKKAARKLLTDTFLGQGVMKIRASTQGIGFSAQINIDSSPLAYEKVYYPPSKDDDGDNLEYTTKEQYAHELHLRRTNPNHEKSRAISYNNVTYHAYNNPHAIRNDGGNYRFILPPEDYYNYIPVEELKKKYDAAFNTNVVNVDAETKEVIPTGDLPDSQDRLLSGHHHHHQDAASSLNKNTAIDNDPSFFCNPNPDSIMKHFIFDHRTMHQRKNPPCQDDENNNNNIDNDERRRRQREEAVNNNNTKNNKNTTTNGMMDEFEDESSSNSNNSNNINQPRPSEYSLRYFARKNGGGAAADTIDGNSNTNRNNNNHKNHNNNILTSIPQNAILSFDSEIGVELKLLNKVISTCKELKPKEVTWTILPEVGFLFEMILYGGTKVQYCVSGQNTSATEL